MVKRLAAVIGVLALIGIAFTVLVPSSPKGVHCGSLANPDWTKSQTQEVIKKASDLYDQAKGLDLGGEDFAGEATDSANRAAAAYRACEDVRSSRRTLLYVLVAAGLVLPPAIIFVGGGMRRRETTPAS